MIESVIVNEWKAEAALKANGKALIAILEAKFGPVPAEAKEQIKETALDVLLEWLLLAATADSLAAFRRDAGI